MTSKTFSLRIVLLVLAVSTTTFLYNGYAQKHTNKIPLTKHKAARQAKSSGTYTCAPSKKTHRWYINKNHLLIWDDRPFIPHALTLPNEKLRDTRYRENIKNIFSSIDVHMAQGVNDFYIWYGGEIDTPLYGKAFWSPKKYNQWLDRITDYITKKKGTYTFLFTPTFVATPDSPRTIDYFNRTDIKQRIINGMKRFKPLIAKDGLRTLVYYNEINQHAHGIIPPHTKRDLQKFKEMLNYYAKKLKEEIANVPVIIRMAGHENYIPYLFAVSGDYIDGITPQYNAFSPNDVRYMMKSAPYLPFFNSFSKTKLMWVNLQVWFGSPNTWPPYISKKVLFNHHLAAVENGATGFLLDMGDYVEKRHAALTNNSLESTHNWYAKVKNALKNKILAEAKTEKFTKGKYSSLQSWESSIIFKKSRLTKRQVFSILRDNLPIAALLKRYPFLKMDALFDRSRGIWGADIGIVITGEGGYELYSFEIDDTTGKIIRDSLSLEKAVKKLGYTFTQQSELNDYIKETGFRP